MPTRGPTRRRPRARPGPGRLRFESLTDRSVPSVTAADDAYTTPPGQALVVAGPGVLANDADSDGGPLAAALVSGPANGLLALTPNGSFVYMPNRGFVGPDTFIYQAQDAGGELSAPGTVTIDVVQPNRPPVAADDDVAATEDVTLTGPSVLANDTDPDGDPLTAELVSGPANGTVTLNADGTFTYVPAPNYHGSDSFTYRVSDGQETSAPSTVRITVAPVNDAPVAGADSYSTEQNRSLAVPAAGVLSNDSDVDGDTLTVEVASGPANGTLTLDPDGSFAYTPRPGFRGTDSFTYRVSDSAGSSGTATVTIRVIPPNGRPVAQGDVYTVGEDGTLKVPAPGVLANDTPPGNLPLTARLQAGPTNGTVTLRPDGSFIYTPNLDFYGSDSFTYRAVDVNGGASAPARVTLTVTPVPDPPVAAADQFVTIQDTTLTVSGPGVLANDSDPDGDALTAVLVTRPSNGTVRLNRDGSFTYTPARGFAGTDSFTYRAVDGYAGSKPVKVTILVRSIAPVPGPAPQAPPTTGGPGVEPGPAETPSGGGSGSTPTVGPPMLPIPPAVSGSVPAVGAPGGTYFVSVPIVPVAPGTPLGAIPPPPSVTVPALPPAPSIPVLPPPPVRGDVSPTPDVVAVPPVIPDLPVVPPIPQLQPDNPVFTGLDDLTKDVSKGKRADVVAGTVVGTGVVATAGYVLLSPRLAYWFLSALLARRTVWKPFDPLEVVFAWDKENGAGGGDDESLEGMVESEPGEPGK